MHKLTHCGIPSTLYYSAYICYVNQWLGCSAAVASPLIIPLELSCPLLAFAALLVFHLVFKA